MTNSRKTSSRILAACVLATGAVLAPVSAAQAATPSVAHQPTPLVRDCPTRKALAKPTNLLLACADGNEYVSHITWKTWGTKRATGKGTLYLNDCNPDCASGHFHGYSASVLLNAVTHIRGKLFYTQYQLAWTAGGKRHVEKAMPISR